MIHGENTAFQQNKCNGMQWGKTWSETKYFGPMPILQYSKEEGQHIVFLEKMH